jgi:hypothetical protein
LITQYINKKEKSKLNTAFASKVNKWQLKKLILSTNKIFFNNLPSVKIFKYKPYIQKLIIVVNLNPSYYSTCTSSNKVVNNSLTILKSYKIFNPKIIYNFLQFNKNNIPSLLTLRAEQLNKSVKYTEVRYTKLNLVLSNIGVFVNKNLSIVSNLRVHKYKYLYSLRKKKYSFLNPNQVKTSILKKKKFINFL